MLYLRNTYLNQGHKDFALFWSPCFITSGFTLRSMIHFDLIFVYSARYRWSSFAYIYISNWASIIFFNRLSFLQWITFVLALKFSCPYIYWTFFWTLLFHWSISQSWYQYYTVLIILVLQWIVISGSISSPILFFFFKVVLDILGPSHFYMNFRITLSISTEKAC